jgi:hypothetical protein
MSIGHFFYFAIFFIFRSVKNLKVLVVVARSALRVAVARMTAGRWLYLPDPPVLLLLA